MLDINAWYLSKFTAIFAFKQTCFYEHLQDLQKVLAHAVRNPLNTGVKYWGCVVLSNSSLAIYCLSQLH